MDTRDASRESVAESRPMTLTPRLRLAAFLVLTFGLSSIFYVQIAAAGKMRMLPTLGLMWCPGAAAMIVRLASQRNLRGTGWGWGATRWQAVAYLLPPALALVLYGFVWMTGIGRFAPTGLALPKDAGIQIPLPMLLAVLATVGFVQSVVFALGEEIGWRGFLVPELSRVSSFTTTAFVSGAVWSVYHYPLILFANYGSGVPKWFALLAFTWMVVASAFVYAWLRLKSGSVWTAAFLHASHNLFIQQIFDPLTSDRGPTKYVTTEFGIGLAIGYSILAWYFWRRRGEVVAAATEPAAV